MIFLNVAAVLIAFREGLEAALIVGILLSYVRRIGRADRAPLAILGVVVAVLSSAVLAVLMNRVGATLETPYEQLFEGTTMLLAVGVLTWMIFWMRYQSRFMKRELEARAQTAISTGAGFSLFALAFLSVFREGIETALFLAANAFAADGLSTLLGALLGLACAVAAGIAIYGLAVHINLKLFFDVTSIFLVLFAAGLLAHVVHEYQEIGLLPMLMTPAWNTAAWLSNESPLGSILNSLVGYNAEPSVLEVIGYALYWVVIVLGVHWWTQHLAKRLLPPAPVRH
ncbi:MAG: FTR1 family protein [Anaerolineae bacterium]